MTEPNPLDQQPPQKQRPDWDSMPYGGDLFGEMHLAEQGQASGDVPIKDSLFPGLAICGVASAAAAWLSEH